MSVASAGGVRQVGADDFFRFHLTTAIEPDELLLAVEFDQPGPRTFGSFREFTLRQGDFCLAGAAVSTEREAREVLSGNICRCTGYAGLIQAVLEASEQAEGARAAS